MARKTDTERLQDLNEKIKELENQKNLIMARETERKRTELKNKKIIAGGNMFFCMGEVDFRHQGKNPPAEGVANNEYFFQIAKKFNALLQRDIYGDKGAKNYITLEDLDMIADYLLFQNRSGNWWNKYLEEKRRKQDRKGGVNE